METETAQRGETARPPPRNSAVVKTEAVQRGETGGTALEKCPHLYDDT